MTQDDVTHKTQTQTAAPAASVSTAQRMKNNVKKLREERLLSKAELARQAGVSALTVDRIESGMPCRMDTKRKIILALGMTIAEKDQVFERAPEGEQE